ncbi:MAG: histidine kinase N-terminal 7TM domain-containing protein [Anaerolineales bacterium]|nr:histidine kinase N-terminal 7TM domain-containing protein [Anaerolineales bacterium]
MIDTLITSLRTLNELLTAGIAITAFSLLLYALSFNLRDRVARTFAIILICVVIVFVCDAIAGTTPRPEMMELWLRVQWVGIVFLPSAYLQLSDALLATTGRPSRGRRRLAVRLSYLISLAFLLTLPFYGLVGRLVHSAAPAPYLERTWVTWVFTLYYAVAMALSGVNFLRAYARTHTRSSRRRMGYLLIGALAPALGSYPYLLFGSGFAQQHTVIFWLAASLSNLLVSVLLVMMAYAVAFFGVYWPDRVVKRRLFKWLMRGPVTASTVLAITTLVRRWGESLGMAYTAAVPIIMVGSLLLMEHLITLVAPLWERWLFHGGDREDMQLLQQLEERLLTSTDLSQYLESLLAAVCDRLQASTGFIAALSSGGLNLLVTLGNLPDFEKEGLSAKLLSEVSDNGEEEPLFRWGDYWLAPLYAPREDTKELLGLLGVLHPKGHALDSEQREALALLAQRAAIALEDRLTQQQVFSSLEALTPKIEFIQRLRAASRYNGGASLTAELSPTGDALEQDRFSRLVKEALTHYWGGPKLTQSPLLSLHIVQQALEEHQGNPTNALRAVLRQAIEHIRPEGERRFTAEWILYNLLELKFMEGRSVREVALKLAMSEADLYRKQRVAIEAVAEAIVDMERSAAEEKSPGVQLAN